MSGVVAWQKLIALITFRHQSLISLGQRWISECWKRDSSDVSAKT
jgi:hypothetical protein